MLRVIPFLLLLSACGVFRPDPVPAAFVPGCTDYVALARAVVDGRERGQSRVEQRLLVDDGKPYAAIHRAMVESVYDWPRPTVPRDWRLLSEVTSRAAEDRCLNRPASALQGRLIPP